MKYFSASLVIANLFAMPVLAEGVAGTTAAPCEQSENKKRALKDCPPGSQGGFFGTRCIPPGDKDFNRGSLSGKGR
jgi:hypothetical protein